MWSIQSNIIEPYQVIRQSLGPVKLSRWQITRLLLRSVLGDVSPGIAILLVGSVAMVILYLITREKSVRMPHELPVVQENSSHFEDIIVKGRKMVCDTFWDMGQRPAMDTDMKFWLYSIPIPHTSRSISAIAL